MNTFIFNYLCFLSLLFYLLPCIVGQNQHLEDVTNEKFSPLEKMNRREFFNLREDKLVRKIVSRVRKREEDDLLLDLVEQEGLEKMFSSPTVLRQTIKANPMLLSFKALREIHEEEDISLLSPERGLKALKNVRLGFKLGMGLVKKLKTTAGKEELFNQYKLTDEKKAPTSEISQRKRQIAELIDTLDPKDIEGHKMIRNLIFEDQVGDYIDHQYFFGKDGDLPEYAKFNKDIIYSDPFTRRLFQEAGPMFEEFLQHPGKMINKMQKQLQPDQSDIDISFN